MEMEMSNSSSGLGLCTGPGQARQEVAEEKLGDGRNSRGEAENQR